MPIEPKVAVLLATYNGSKFVAEFLESLLLQSLKSFVVFVRDDCSSDGTLDIVRSYSSKLEIVIDEGTERVGPASSFLALLRTAGADFDCYSFADQDDYWHIEKIERASKALNQHRGRPSMYFARVEYVDERLEHLGFSPLVRHYGIKNALVENIAMGCTIALNREARELIMCATPVSMVMHDWWIYIVLSALGTVVADDFISLKYRSHSNNTIGVSTSVLLDYKKKVGRFIKRDRGIFGLSDQTNQLKASYWDLLSRDQRDLIDMLINGKKSVALRLRLFICSPFIRQRTADTLILRLLFLINRY
jgi:glycosyltransferase involved in cell wall biosynthesis